jgi:hypothetical protein
MIGSNQCPHGVVAMQLTGDLADMLRSLIRAEHYVNSHQPEAASCELRSLIDYLLEPEPVPAPQPAQFCALEWD